MKSNFTKNLGKLIKERRKELNLTQSSVCDGFITRNMLSRIETGDACPSLDSLLYIAEKLKMPVEYFLSKDQESAALYKKIEYISQIRNLYASKQYRKCVDYCNSININDCEINLIKAECELKLAEESMMNYKLNTAIELLSSCIESSQNSIYSIDRISATADFYRKLIQCVKENHYPRLELFNNKGIYLVESEFIAFTYTLAIFNDCNQILNTIPSLSNPIYINFLKALELIAAQNYDDSKAYLIDVLEANPGYFTLYFTIQNLELCYKKMENYKEAYQYAKMRLELLEKFND